MGAAPEPHLGMGDGGTRVRRRRLRRRRGVRDVLLLQSVALGDMATTTSTLDKYQRVPATMAPASPDEIRVTTKGVMKSYLTAVIGRLASGEDASEHVTLQGMGNAISKVVSIAEIVKRRIPAVHQLTSISSTEVVDTYEPLEEGLETVVIKRQVPSIAITLTMQTPSDDAIRNCGYQPGMPGAPAVIDHPPRRKQRPKKPKKAPQPDRTEQDEPAQQQDAPQQQQQQPEQNEQVAGDAEPKPATRKNNNRRGGGGRRGRRPAKASTVPPPASEPGVDSAQPAT